MKLEKLSSVVYFQITELQSRDVPFVLFQVYFWEIYLLYNKIVWVILHHYTHSFLEKTKRLRQLSKNVSNNKGTLGWVMIWRLLLPIKRHGDSLQSLCLAANWGKHAGQLEIIKMPNLDSKFLPASLLPFIN